MIREDSNPDRDYGDFGLAPATADGSAAGPREAALRGLTEQHNTGLLTNEDFETAKAQLLGS